MDYVKSFRELEVYNLVFMINSFKKIAISMAIVPISCTICFSQAVVKGNISADAGIGFGIYSAKTNDPADTASGAVPGLIPIYAEYAITDKIGVGLFFERNGFVTSKKDTSTVRSLNFGAGAAYRIINKDKIVLAAELSAGVSAFRITDDTDLGKANNRNVTSNGSMVQLNINFKIYFGKHIGWFIKAGYGNYNYRYLYDNSDNLPPEADKRLVTVDGKEYLSLSLNGGNIRTGISVKF